MSGHGRELHLEGLEHQWAFWTDMTRDLNLALVGALGTGKTRSLLIKDMLLHLANLEHRGRTFQSMLVEPTFGMVEDILIPTMTDLFKEEMGIDIRVKGERPKLIYPEALGGGQTLLRSAEHPQRLTGTNLSHVGFDEPGQIVFDAWKKGASRARHPLAWARQKFVCGSPEGMGWFAHLFNKPKPGYRTIRARVWHESMRHYPRELKEHFRLDPSQLAAYVDAIFMPMFTGRCYTAFSRAVHHDSQVEYEPMLPLCVAMDFNIDAMRWLLIQETPTEIRVFDEIALGPNQGVFEACRELIDRYSYGEGRIAKHIHELQIYGDASGSARSVVGQTSYEVALDELQGEMRFRAVSMHVPDANPKHRSRVETVQHHLRGQGKIVRISPRCDELTMDLEQEHWVQGRPEIAQARTGPEAMRTHAAAAFGYYLWESNPVTAKHSPVHVPATEQEVDELIDPRSMAL